MAVEGITELNKAVAKPMVTSQAAASKPIEVKQPPQAAAPSEDDPIKIELNVQQRYMRGTTGTMFEKEKFYVFRRADARILLKEKDDYGNAIWRLYRPPVAKAVVDDDGREGVKMTNFNMVELPKADPIAVGSIQVGNDDELREAGIDLDGNSEETVI